MRYRVIAWRGMKFALAEHQDTKPHKELPTLWPLELQDFKDMTADEKEFLLRQLLEVKAVFPAAQVDGSVPGKGTEPQQALAQVQDDKEASTPEKPSEPATIPRLFDGEGKPTWKK